MSRYQIKKELGSGSFGTTYLARDIIDKKDVAFKVLDINKLQAKGISIDIIKNEVTAFAAIAKNPCVKNIACYYDAFETVINGNNLLCIVSEYIEGTDLVKYMEDNGVVDKNELWPIFNQLLIGLKFIHNKGYAHRDIKPDNILITPDKTIKYIDFGLACSVDCNGQRGTLMYMPPEVVTYRNEDSLKGAQAQDIWALGVTMFQLANGINDLPFHYEDDGGNVLPDDAIMRQISYAPEIDSNYKLDDGRTNKYIMSLLFNNWKNRPNIMKAFLTFVGDVYTTDFFYGNN